jgi:hypothetical protein
MITGCGCQTVYDIVTEQTDNQSTMHAKGP